MELTMEQLRDVLELIYFISAPIIAFIAGVALWQIKVTKDTARTNAKRNALSLAAQQCDHYQKYIIPLQNTLDATIEAKSITYLKQSEVIIDGNRIRVKKSYPKDIKDQLNNIGLDLLAVLNSMEAFAMFFTTGSADERIAFSSVGSTFCRVARDLLPEIVPYVDSGHFRNLYQLFLMWNSRIESKKLLHEKEELEQKLRKVDKKFIEPVGTD